MSHSGGVKDSHPLNTTEAGDLLHGQPLIKDLALASILLMRIIACFTMALENVYVSCVSHHCLKRIHDANNDSGCIFSFPRYKPAHCEKR